MLAVFLLAPLSARFVNARYVQSPSTPTAGESDSALKSIEQPAASTYSAAATPAAANATTATPPLSQPPLGFNGDVLDPIATTLRPRSSAILPPLPSYPASAAIPAIMFRHPHPFSHTMRTHVSKYTEDAVEHPDVLECVTLAESLDPSTGVTYRRRLLRVRNSAPWLFRSLLRSDVVEFEEESVYDSEERVLQMASRNISYRGIIEANEASKFIELRDGQPGAGGTLFVQTGTCRAGALFGPLRSQIEQYAAWYVRRGGVNAVGELERKLCKEAAAGVTA